MTPFSPYARCEDCGAPAGTTCMGLDDRPAIEVCDGRELAINDSVARTKAPRAPGTSPRTRARRRHSEGVPVMVPCEHCTAPVRLWGMGMVTGVAWCSTPTCRAARKAAQARAHRERRRASQPPCERCGAPSTGYMTARYCGPTCRAAAIRDSRQTTTPGTCSCGTVLPVPRHHGRVHCSDRCRIASATAAAVKRNRAKISAKHPAKPCHYCAEPVPQDGRHRNCVIVACPSPVCQTSRSRIHARAAKAKQAT